jgi:hypothetical protein
MDRTIKDAAFTYNTDDLVTRYQRETLIKPFVFRIYQVMGLYPRSTSRATHSSGTKAIAKFRVRIWLAAVSASLFFLTILGLLKAIKKEWSSHEKQLGDLEFFTLLDLQFYLSPYTETFWTFLVMTIKSHKLIPLVSAVEEFLNKVMEQGNSRILISQVFDKKEIFIFFFNLNG